MKLYMQILSDNNRIITNHPGWFNDSGNLLSDEELVTQNRYLIVDEIPVFDANTQRISIADINDWQIVDGKAIRSRLITSLTQSEIEELSTAKLLEFKQSVDIERDRRIESGMTFAGTRFQTRPSDRENVSGASIMALAAMMNGAQSGNLRWHGGDSDFVWIAEDNSNVTMDAQTMFAFGQAMAFHKSALIFKGRYIKDNSPIGTNITDDALWA